MFLKTMSQSTDAGTGAPAQELHLFGHVISSKDHRPEEPQQPAVVPPSSTKPATTQVPNHPSLSPATAFTSQERSADADWMQKLVDHDSAVKRHNNNITNSNDSTNEGLFSQFSDSQLDHTGDFDAVAGSQSVLSQELIFASQGDGDAASLNSGSQSSTSMAKRLGLLRQDTIESTASADGADRVAEAVTSPSVTATAVAAAAEDSDFPMSQESLPLSQDPVILAEQAKAASASLAPPPSSQNGAETCTPMKDRSQSTKVSYTSPLPSTKGANMFSPKGSMRDTPIRKSKNFGSLLNAVQMITEQETVSTELYKDLEAPVVQKTAGPPSVGVSSGPPSVGTSSGGISGPPSVGVAPGSHARPVILAPPARFTEAPVVQRTAGPPSVGVSSGGYARPVILAPSARFTPPLRKAKVRKEPKGLPKSSRKRTPEELHAAAYAYATQKKPKPAPVINGVKMTPQARNKAELAKARRAAALAEKTITDPDMAKKLLLSMALMRENPRQAPEEWPKKGSVIPPSFFWAHYPPLENILKDHMADYYELSTTACQSAEQQQFNNMLVEVVRAEADKQQWIFAECYHDKGLRDRIRCYYKTHIQNAKKRLRTMVENPTKKANAKHLCAHLDLIQQAKMEEERRAQLTLLEQQQNNAFNSQSTYSGKLKKIARIPMELPPSKLLTAGTLANMQEHVLQEEQRGGRSPAVVPPAPAQPGQASAQPTRAYGRLPTAQFTMTAPPHPTPKAPQKFTQV